MSKCVYIILGYPVFFICR